MNLRPLWGTAAEALASLSQKFPNVVWALVLQELQSISTKSVELCEKPSWYKDSSTDTEEPADDEDAREEEFTWRAPSASKLGAVVKAWMRAGWGRDVIIQVRMKSVLLSFVLLTQCAPFISSGTISTGTL